MFDKDLFLSICEKYGVDHSEIEDSPKIKIEDGVILTDKEKQINAQVITIRANLHEIMKDIEPKGLYNKLVSLDREIYKIREIIKEEEKNE